MSEIKSESISSLVDNYTPSKDDSVNAHLIDSMLKDEELSSTWQNYHLIGDVLRDEVPQALQLDLSETISSAIAQEATILSPNSSNKASTQNDDESEHNNDTVTKSAKANTVVDATSRFKAKISGLVKPMGQIAIAASAAVLMIVGVQHNLADNASPVTPSQVVQTMPLAGYANPVSFDLQPGPSAKSEQNKLQSKQMLNEQAAAGRIAKKRRLQALLKDHNQQVKLGSNIP